jgi:hypothetical protein
LVWRPISAKSEKALGPARARMTRKPVPPRPGAIFSQRSRKGLKLHKAEGPCCFVKLQSLPASL